MEISQSLSRKAGQYNIAYQNLSLVQDEKCWPLLAARKFAQKMFKGKTKAALEILRNKEKGVYCSLRAVFIHLQVTFSLFCCICMCC